MQELKDRLMARLHLARNDLGQARAVKESPRNNKRLPRLYKRARPLAERPEGVNTPPTLERTALPSVTTDSLLCIPANTSSTLPRQSCPFHVSTFLSVTHISLKLFCCLLFFLVRFELILFCLHYEILKSQTRDFSLTFNLIPAKVESVMQWLWDHLIGQTTAWAGGRRLLFNCKSSCPFRLFPLVLV